MPFAADKDDMTDNANLKDSNENKIKFKIPNLKPFSRSGAIAALEKGTALTNSHRICTGNIFNL